MKLIKKLQDWKIWVFLILPIILIVAWLAILIYAIDKSVTEPALIIIAQILLIVAAILMLGYSIFCTIKQKNLLRSMFSMLFAVCCIGLLVATIVIIPKLCETTLQAERLYEKYKGLSYYDAEFDEAQYAWRAARDEQLKLSYTVQFMSSGSFIALSLSSICAKSVKKDNPQADEENKEVAEPKLT